VRQDTPQGPAIPWIDDGYGCGSRHGFRLALVRFARGGVGHHLSYGLVVCEFMRDDFVSHCGLTFK
jgi:hypothetical protein